MRTEECRCWTGLLAVQTLQLKNIRRIMKQKKNLFQTRMRQYCCSSSAAALLGSQIFTDYRGKTRGRFCAPHSNEQIWVFFLKVVHFLILNIRWVSIVNKNRFMISANHYIPLIYLPESCPPWQDQWHWCSQTPERWCWPSICGCVRSLGRSAKSTPSQLLETNLTSINNL